MAVNPATCAFCNNHFVTVEHKRQGMATSPGTTPPESNMHNDHKYGTDLFIVVATHIGHNWNILDDT
jgi:hypothetical protein